MKKVFLESNGYNMIGFIFRDGMVAFDCETIEQARNMDISGVIGCETAEEAAINCNTEVFPFVENEWEEITNLDNEFKVFRKQSGMTVSGIAKYFEIPYRTVKQWDSGERKCAEYLLNLMIYKLKNEKVGGYAKEC